MSGHAEFTDTAPIEAEPSLPPRPRARFGALRRLWRPVRWVALRGLAVMLVLVMFFGWIVNPPTTWTIMHEAGDDDRSWTRADDIAPVMLRSVVASEDANFCVHWGFDMTEIRRVIARGEARGASTLTQQTAKNVFLWQGRSWIRKALETAYTPMIEALWSKRRILEVYLNVAEFGPGIFGIRAAAQHHFGTTPDKLSARQAAALASVLPNPKNRAAKTGSNRARAIADGAETIRRQIAALPIAARHAIAADPQLPRHAQGHRVQGGVQNVDLRVGNGGADIDDALPGCCGLCRGPDRGLRGTIHIFDLRISGLLQILHQRGRQRLTTDHQVFHA